MKTTALSVFALAAGLSAPALAQQSPTFLVVPNGAQQGAQANPQGQQYMLVPVQRDQSGAASTSEGSGGTGSDASAQSGILDRYTREVFERAYQRGRLDERKAAGTKVTDAELERIAQQLFIQGYVRGRYVERASQEGLDPGQIQQVRQDVKAAREAIADGNYDQAREALRRVQRQLPTGQTAGTQAGSSQGANPGPEKSAGGERQSSNQGAQPDPMLGASRVIHPKGPGSPGAQAAAAAEASNSPQATAAPMQGIRRLHPDQKTDDPS